MVIRMSRSLFPKPESGAAQGYGQQGQSIQATAVIYSVTRGHEGSRFYPREGLLAGEGVLLLGRMKSRSPKCRSAEINAPLTTQKPASSH